jgi:hypothetical protein
MNLLAFTDFHGNQDAYRKAKVVIAERRPELVIVAGDIINHDYDRATKHLIDLATAGRPIYFVPGNMDNAELARWSGTENVHGLHGHCIYAEGLALIGLGGSPYSRFKTVFEYSEGEAEEVLKEAQKFYHGGKLVLVSHCPPQGTKLDEVSDGGHAGSTSVHTYVEKNHPLLVISGHVHEARGVDKMGSTSLVNPGPAQHGNYADIVLNEHVTVQLRKLP